MSLPIPEKFHDLLTRPILCAFTTINPDGQPHTVPVWCDFDGEHVRLNAPAATKKARNLDTNNKLSVLIIDPQNPGHWIEIQGHVGEVRDDAHGSDIDGSFFRRSQGTRARKAAQSAAGVRATPHTISVTNTTQRLISPSLGKRLGRPRLVYG